MTDRTELIWVGCYCSPGCNTGRWADIVEALELGLDESEAGR